MSVSARYPDPVRPRASGHGALQTAEPPASAGVEAALHDAATALCHVNVSLEVLKERIRALRWDGLRHLGASLEHPSRCPALDVPELGARIRALAAHLDREQRAVEAEVRILGEQLSHLEATLAHGSADLFPGAASLCEPAALVIEAVDLLQDSLAACGIEVTVLAEPAGPVFVDRTQVRRILVNLLSNAQRALADGGDNRQVLVRISPAAEDRVQITIEDNGRGIEESLRGQLFTWGASTRGEGHGIGLAASFWSARNLGGTLELRYPGSGRGAAFVLDLPGARPRAEGPGDSL